MSKLRLVMLPLALIFIAAGCGKSGSGARETIIRVEGSDTMVNVAQAWAEDYDKLHPEVSVQVLGGGSGVGIASLIDGNCDMADTSRKMKADEIARATAKQGAAPIEHVVGFDALAIYVHKDNPIDSISLEELAEIYGDGGTITKWSQLGVKIPSGTDKITWLNRQNSSGTYVYFRETILGDKRDYNMGSLNQNGSKDVISMIAHTPGAIGYSGMGYATNEVKMLKVSHKKGEPGVAPSVENVHNNTYPITRPLQIYTLGEPKGAVKAYLDWIKSAEGQQVVLDKGYVPVFKHDK
ncbi:MAG: phosphate ABC transporter substrate-binding protein [Thermoguttaceae bacterium]